MSVPGASPATADGARGWTLSTIVASENFAPAGQSRHRPPCIRRPGTPPRFRARLDAHLPTALHELYGDVRDEGDPSLSGKRLLLYRDPDDHGPRPRGRDYTVGDSDRDTRRRHRRLDRAMAPEALMADGDLGRANVTGARASIRPRARSMGRWVDAVIQGDALEVLRAYPVESVHLAVTSPPYNVGIAYAGYSDDRRHEEYLAWLASVWKALERVLVPGGRFALNVAPTSIKDFRPIHHDLSIDLRRMGFIMRTEIIWYKQTMGRRTAWGSWRSPSNPHVVPSWEYVLVFSKGQWKLEGRREDADITAAEFQLFSDGYWAIPPERRRAGHPAPFPEALIARLVKSTSFRGQTVLDMFGGPGPSRRSPGGGRLPLRAHRCLPRVPARWPRRLIPLRFPPTGREIHPRPMVRSGRTRRRPDSVGRPRRPAAHREGIAVVGGRPGRSRRESSRTAKSSNGSRFTVSARLYWTSLSSAPELPCRCLLPQPHGVEAVHSLDPGAVPQAEGLLDALEAARIAIRYRTNLRSMWAGARSIAGSAPGGTGHRTAAR